MKRSHSVWAYVVHLIIAVISPLLAFGAFLIIRSAVKEQQAIVITAYERAQGAAADLDRELRNLQDLLSVLVTSHYLLAGDFVGFRRHAVPLFKAGDLGLVATDLSGQPLVNTCTANDRAFPVSKALEQVAHNDVSNGRAFISDLITEPITGEPLLTIDLPVWREDNFAYILSLCALPRILQVLTEEHLPNGWSATVVDRQGGTVASIKESDSGSFAVAGDDTVAISAVNESSIVDEWGNSDPGYRVSSPVDLAGWTVTINVPSEIFSGPARRSLIVLLVAGGGTLALVLVLAVNIGRRIVGPITDLTGIARALANGGLVASPYTGINEADLVAQILRSTGEDLNRRTAELTQTIEALRNSEKRFRKLSEDLRRALDERTELLNRMVSAQENERQRIARELHDHFGQYFAAMLLGLNAAEKAWRRHDEGHQRIAELKAMTSAVSQEVHQLSWELRPTALDDLDLEAAMANYLEKWRERFDPDADFVGNLQGRRLSAPIEITLYRVLQEAMTNIAKHANAERISVVLEADIAEVRLIVEDDGTGIRHEDLGVSGRQTSGFGLLGIRERLALVGGSLTIETAPDRGTALFCRIPA
jgi:signal transduction histidine kinase